MRKTVFWGQQPVHTSLPFSPFGVQRKPYTNERAKRASCADGRMDGWTVIKSVDFPYFDVCKRLCIYVLIYVLKICHQDSYGFQNLMSSLGVGVMNLENPAGR